MFKKAVVFLMSVFCILALYQENSQSQLSAFGSPYEIYAQQNSSLAKIIRSTAIERQKIFFKTGESIIVSEQYENSILQLLDAKIVFKETSSRGTSVYGYSKKLKNSINVKGQKINLQIFYGEDKTVLGSPIILGSF